MPLLNPPAVLQWNLRKRYLLDLEARGVRVPRTAVIAQGTRRPAWAP